MALASLGKKGNPRNPKAHDHSTIDASVGRFGYVEPIVLDERTGLIISGHGRTQTLADMQARGEAPPEGIDVDAGGNWLVPVVRGWSSRTDSEASAALIALNRSTELGGWDDEALLELLEDLDGVENGFDGIGFGEDDLGALRGALEELEEGAEEGEGFPGSVDGGLEPPAGSYREQYGLNLVFPDQDAQERAYAHLVELGYEVRVVVV